MSEDQKAAFEKELAEFQGSDGYKKLAKEKQVFETARLTAEFEANEQNKTRNGVGTRVTVSGTRGKSPIIVSFEQFDDTKPETLPKSVAQFMELTSNDEKVLVDYLIRGYNSASYEAASDPLAEYVVSSWPADVQSTFRQAVRNYSRGLGISLEDAVDIIRPGFTAKFGS